MATILSKAEKSYIVTSLTSSPPLRQDGRAPHDYRIISVITGDEVAPLANGSAKIRVGGTEVVSAVRLEVEDLTSTDAHKGRIRCNVTCSPAAYPHLNGNQQDDIQSDLTSILQATFTSNDGSTSTTPTFLHQMSETLTILPGRKAWLLNLDAVVLSDGGNVYDVLFMACRAALWNTRVPKTRAVEYRDPTQKGVAGEKTINNDVEMTDLWKSSVQTKKATKAADFELEDYWDHGEPLAGRARCPIAITLNLLPTVHILDATRTEEQAVPLKLVIIYSFSQDGDACFAGMRMLGPGDLPLEYLKGLLGEGENYAKNLILSLDSQLKTQWS